MIHYSLPSLPLLSASAWSFVSALNFWTQNCRKSQILRLPKVSRLKHERYAHALILFVSRNVFNDFWGKKKRTRNFGITFGWNFERVPYFHWFKNHWNKVYYHSETVRLPLNINILFAVSVPHVHVNTLNYNYALIFYPFMNTVKPQV